MNSRIDVRHLLPTIAVPTTVMDRAGDRVVSPDHGRYVARTVPGARYIELPGEDHLPFTGDAAALIEAIADALGVEAPVPARAPRIRVEPLFDGPATVQLSSRELEIMRWVARGKSNQQIAIALYVAESTVRKHLQNIYRKLNVPSRTAALALLNGTLTKAANESV
jgi:DNA-binding CsgD family transcriptional regulator